MTTSSQRSFDRRFDALVLAGSYGWGGAHIPGLPPRPLAPVALKPLITYALDWLEGGGARSARVCANGSSSILRDQLGASYSGIDLIYEEDTMPRGPAGCVRDAARHTSCDTLIVTEGTIVPRIDLNSLLHAHAESGAALTVVTSCTNRCADGDWTEPLGIYVFSRRALSFIPELGFYDIKEALIPKLHAAGELVKSFACERHQRVANLETYVAANAWAVGELVAGDNAVPSDWVRHGTIVAHATALIDPDALCVGPLVIGPHAQIPAGATIVGPAVIGQHVAIGSGALVSRSVVNNFCQIGERAVVHDSVLGDHAIVESDAQLYYALKLQEAVKRRNWLQSLIGIRGRALAPAGWARKPIEGGTYVADRV